MDKQVRAYLMLFVTAFIWGVAFVAQKQGMDYVGPFTFGATRMVLGSLTLLPVVLITNKKSIGQTVYGASKAEDRKVLLRGGLVAGTILFVANSFQQFGILYTSASKAGFLTAMYIVFVPIISTLIGKKLKKSQIIAVPISGIGLYFLCVAGMGEGFVIGKGDLLELGGALCFAFHIMAMDHFAPKTNPIKLSMMQFAVMGVWSWIAAFIFETPTIENILAAWLPIVYAGMLSCGIAYTFQALAQRDAEPSFACLIMSLESVFAALGGAVILKEHLSANQSIGCILMFSAILVAQQSGFKKQEN